VKGPGIWGSGFLDSSSFKKYLLPGFIFQSVLIRGGYGTGSGLGLCVISIIPLSTLGLYKIRAERITARSEFKKGL